MERFKIRVITYTINIIILYVTLFAVQKMSPVSEGDSDTWTIMCLNFIVVYHSMATEINFAWN